MDAQALLSSQGWRGKGHSLHATDDSIGLAKPLLLSRKENNLGVGNQHYTSDQWWLDAFDEQVKGLDTSNEGKVVQTVTTGKLNTVGNGGGRYALYTSFVKGGFLEGSIQNGELEELSPNDSPERSPRRDSGTSKLPTTSKKSKKHSTNGETKEERRARKEAKRARKAAELSAEEILECEAQLFSEANGPQVTSETKEERRAKKHTKRRKDERAQRAQARDGS